MKTKHLIILAAIFLFLLALLASRGIFVKEDIETVEYESIDFSVRPTEVYAIEVAKGGSGQDPFRLEKRDEEWIVPAKWDGRVKKEKIFNFMDSVNALKGEVRSSNEELLADYGIGEDEAFSIAFIGEDGEVLEKLYLGLKKAGRGSSFVRREGASIVSLADRDLYTALGIYGDPREAKIKAKNWLDLAFIRIDPSQIDSILMRRRIEERAAVTAHLERLMDEEKGMKKWVAAEPDPVFGLDARKIRNYLRSLKGLQADDMLDPEGGPFGFEEPFAELILESGYGKDSFIVGSTQDEGSYFRYVKADEDKVYKVAVRKLGDTFADLSKFFEDNPLQIEEEKLSEFTARDGDTIVTIDGPSISDNAEYMNKLKNFEAEKLYFGTKYAGGIKASAAHSLELVYNDQRSLTIFVAEESEEDAGDYLCQIEEREGMFYISGETFENIFGGIGNLKISAETIGESGAENPAGTSEETKDTESGGELP